MNGGDIAALIAAGLFAVLVGLLAIPLVKLGRLFDEAGTAIRDFGTSVTPLIDEATTTISETNKQLARVDTITRGVADATGNVASLIALTAATVGGPLIKLAGFSAGVTAALRGLKPKARAK